MRARTPFPLEEATRIYLSGKTVSDVSRILGVSPSRVYKALHRRGVLRQPGRRAYSGRFFPIDEARCLYVEQGKTLAEIAARYRYTVSAVYQRLKCAGVPMRRPGQRRKAG